MNDDARRWYFDFISPFAYLQWPKVRPLLAEFGITPVPIVFGAVLDALGQRGPAEIPHKREFTYRHVLWMAREAGVPMRFPPAHPFNPIAALRLCVAAGCSAASIDAIFDHLWGQGLAGDDIDALAPVAESLGLTAEAANAPEVKARLRHHTDSAIAVGVFGVPTLALGNALFWGNDSHAFAVAALRDPALFDDAEMQRVAALPVGIRRG